MDKTSSVIEIAENVYDLYGNLSKNAGNTLLQFIGGEEGIANLFSLSNYNTTSWITDYANEAFGTVLHTKVVHLPCGCWFH